MFHITRTGSLFTCRIPTYRPDENVSVGHRRQSLLPLTSILVPLPSSDTLSNETPRDQQQFLCAAIENDASRKNYYIKEDVSGIG